MKQMERIGAAGMVSLHLPVFAAGFSDAAGACAQEAVTPYPQICQERAAAARRKQQENARSELTAAAEKMDANTIFLGCPI